MEGFLHRFISPKSTRMEMSGPVFCSYAQECSKDLIQYLTLMSPMIYDVIDSNVQANIDFRLL